MGLDTNLLLTALDAYNSQLEVSFLSYFSLRGDPKRDPDNHIYKAHLIYLEKCKLTNISPDPKWRWKILDKL